MASLSKIFIDFDENFLTCIVCYEQFSDPKSLDCLHTLCRKCALQLAKIVPMKGRSILCPICNQLTVLPPGGVEKLKTDFKVMSLLDFRKSFKRHIDGTGSRPPSFRRQPTQKKDSTDAEAEANPSVDIDLEMCPTHSKPFQFYCISCQVLVCNQCVTHAGAHHAHVMDTPLRGAQSCQSRLKAKLPTIADRVNRLESSSGWIEDNLLQQMDRAAEGARSIREIGDLLKCKVDEVVSKKVLEISQRHGEEKKRLERIKEEVEEQLFDMCAYKQHAERYVQSSGVESSKLEQLLLALQLSYRLSMLPDVPVHPQHADRYVVTSMDAHTAGESIEKLIDFTTHRSTFQSDTAAAEALDALPYYKGRVERKEAEHLVSAHDGCFLLRKNTKGQLVVTNQIRDRALHFKVLPMSAAPSADEVEEMLKSDPQLNLRIPVTTGVERQYENVPKDMQGHSQSSTTFSTLPSTVGHTPSFSSLGSSLGFRRFGGHTQSVDHDDLSSLSLGSLSLSLGTLTTGGDNFQVRNDDSPFPDRDFDTLPFAPLGRDPTLRTSDVASSMSSAAFPSNAATYGMAPHSVDHTDGHLPTGSKSRFTSGGRKKGKASEFDWEEDTDSTEPRYLCSPALFSHRQREAGAADRNNPPLPPVPTAAPPTGVPPPASSLGSTSLSPGATTMSSPPYVELTDLRRRFPSNGESIQGGSSRPAPAGDAAEYGRPTSREKKQES